jgi:hypothetical protein
MNPNVCCSSGSRASTSLASRSRGWERDPCRSVPVEGHRQRLLCLSQRSRRSVGRRAEDHTQGAVLHGPRVEGKQQSEHMVQVTELGRQPPRTRRPNNIEPSEPTEQRAKRDPRESIEEGSNTLTTVVQHTWRPLAYRVRLVTFKKLLSLPYAYRDIHADSHSASKQSAVR